MLIPMNPILKRLLKHKRTQMALAADLGYSKQRVNNWFRNDSVPPGEFLKLCDRYPDLRLDDVRKGRAA
jgi:transcriptional regulator with XRE-family HTH domain